MKTWSWAFLPQKHEAQKLPFFHAYYLTEYYWPSNTISDWFIS